MIASNWNPFNPYEVIVSGMTDSEGNFDIDLDWPIPENPDIQVFYFAENVATRVYNHDGPPEPWAFSTSIYPLYSETTLDVGLLMPAGLAGNLAMHTAESMRRIREFYDVELGYDFGRLDTRLTTVKDGTSHFNSGQLYIFLYAGAAWSMNIHAHEYGHYVHAMLPMQFPSHGGYCDVNEYCDDDPANGDCGHCLECDEDEAIAFIEGWAEFCAEIANDYMEENYSVPASITRVSVQSIGDCYNRYETFPQNPLINEGFFAAALYDLVDEDYGEEDINNPQGFHDNVGGYLVDVFTCVNTACGTLGAMPQTPADVLQCFLEQHPGDRAGITESYRNNQYYFDTEGPGAPTNLTSNPPVGIPTPDYTIQVTWDEPVDDSSGVNAYGTNWIRNSPLMPGPVAVLGDVTFDDSPTLSPGEWYYCIRARDAAGNWSDSFAWIGPVIISAADPADLAGYSPASWDYPFVPMNAPDGGPTIAHVSTMLNGGTADTYWNMAFRNKGDQYTVTTTADIILDGAQVMDNVPVPSIGGLAEGGRYNQGPLTIPAGRHTLGMFLDSSELMSEDDEFDNYWLGQWAWRPQIYLVAGSVTTHLAPPDPLGGFAYFNDHQAFYTLCSGHRIANHSLYQAVFILPEEREADYDLGIFEKDNSPNLGFRTQLAYSGRPAGKLDVVLANGWNAGMSEEYDIGVYNESFNPEFADGQYSIGRVKDNPIGDNYDKYFGFLDEDRMIDIYTFQFGTESNGYVTFELNPHINKTMNLSYFDEDFTVGRLADATETVTSVAGEPVILHLQAPVGSVCAVAAWMDPVGPISSAHNYDLDFAITKSDPEVYESQNWAASIVPRDKDDRLYPYNPPVPDRLVGNADSTFVYAMERNSSPAVGLGACPAHEVAIHVDGELLDTLTPANALNPGIGTAFTGSGFYNIPGGRHTLTMVLDPTDAVDEIIEYNNEGGNQWVWSP
ncbi:MAG: hypothetical protein KAH56_14000, partial [Candidatus Krumholzibacteria bacterium]|nr:hypothetical protein [Candidatus Krumholzibacteria bacterium]